MRAILIAPDLADKNLFVQELEIEPGLDALHKHLDCHCIDAMRLDEAGNTMYLDDNGLSEKDYFFQIGQYPNPIAGRGLIVGTDLTTGESVSTALPVELIENVVAPLTPQEAYELAKEADAVARKQIRDEGREASTIFLSSSEIMEGAWYADRLGIEE